MASHYDIHYHIDTLLWKASQILCQKGEEELSANHGIVRRTLSIVKVEVKYMNERVLDRHGYEAGTQEAKAEAEASFLPMSGPGMPFKHNFK